MTAEEYRRLMSNLDFNTDVQTFSVEQLGDILKLNDSRRIALLKYATSEEASYRFPTYSMRRFYGEQHRLVNVKTVNIRRNMPHQYGFIYDLHLTDYQVNLLNKLIECKKKTTSSDEDLVVEI